MPPSPRLGGATAQSKVFFGVRSGSHFSMALAFCNSSVVRRAPVSLTTCGADLRAPHGPSRSHAIRSLPYEGQIGGVRHPAGTSEKLLHARHWGGIIDTGSLDAGKPPLIKRALANGLLPIRARLP